MVVVRHSNNAFLGLGRYLRSKCRPLLCLVSVALTVSLWIVSATVFFHTRSYGGAPMSLSKKAVMNGQDQGGLLLDNSDKVVHDGGSRVIPFAQSAVHYVAAEEQKKAEDEKEQEFAERRSRYEQFCRKDVRGGVSSPYYYEPAKLAVCMVPKVGCSFWKRVFFFLYNETNAQGVTSPFQIDRFFVHFGARRKTKIASYTQKKAMMDNFTKVMFTRDPWLRVWSSYVDKLVLPDSWLDHGRAIVRRRNKTGRGPRSSSSGNKNSSSCPADVTFQEFLDYTINAVKDDHWRPVHSICNPCVFHPHYLGKVETFTKDANHILRKVGLEKLIEGHNTQQNYSEDEISMLTKYHFQIYASRKGIRNCLSHSGVAHRLWMAFVLNGYIGQSLTFPTEEFSAALDGMSNSIEASQKATELLLKYHRALPILSSQQMRQHRRNLMVREYRKAPRDQLEKMADTFKDDFALFGYEARPDDIFKS